MKIADLKLLSDDEQQRILRDSEGPHLSFPTDATLAQLFRERAASVPDAIAVVYNDASVTYKELDSWSDQLAAELVNNYVAGSDRLVALCLDRSIEMTASIIAVWKAGAGYVPISPDAPIERARYILEDTAPIVVLCSAVQQEQMERLLPESIAVRAVDGAWGDEVRHSGAVLPTGISADATDLAYVIYTSGTTGRPKGVMVENRSVVNYVYVIDDLYGLSTGPAKETMLQALSYAFDGGVVPMVLALLTGNTLVHVDDQLWLDSERFTAYLRDNNVTYMNGTPTFYKHLSLGAVPSLKRMVVGGESLDGACLREMTRANNLEVSNEYGPTEATISTTSYPVREHDLAIGRPLANSFVFVLDEALRIVPIGAVGEIYLGGPGVARGYLNMPGETAERFIPNPYQSDEDKRDTCWSGEGRNARIYKTGDLARRRFDGALEYVGRNDSQIKVQGFRVEPAEIESVLNDFPGVRQSSVIPSANREETEPVDGSTSVVGFYVSSSPLDENGIFNYLRANLPAYMIPSELVKIDAYPVTNNGKLDLEKLHELLPGVNAEDGAPRSELEDKLRGVVADVLGVEVAQVGIQDDLFMLGLNSILVIQLISALNMELGISLSVPSLFLAPTVAELAELPEFGALRKRLP